MGNINKVAGDYILEQTSADLLKLSSKEYCDSLVELIAKILENKLSDLEQNALYERIYSSASSTTSTSSTPSTSASSTTSKCTDLAKFYVKIAHLYATIVKTTRPIGPNVIGPNVIHSKNDVETFYEIFMNIDTIGKDNTPIYTQHIKRIMTRIQAKHAQLLDVLKELFETDQINASLNAKRLQELVDTTRKHIVEIYIECEEDFLTGLQLFEAMVAEQIGVQIEKDIAQLGGYSPYNPLGVS
jgi:hypothetical protein